MRSFRSNYQHLRLLLTDTNAAVTCLQECRMPHPLPSPPRGFQLYHQCGPPGLDGLDHGGVCVLVKDHIGHAYLPLTTHLQAVAVRCHLDRLYTICSIYLPPNSPVILRHLVDLIQQLPPPFLLLGDFNARHPMWGDTATNTRGTIIEQLLGSGLCAVLNENFPTHFHSATDTFSCIDLSLCSADIMPNFTWTVSRDLYNSDHFPIRLTLPDPTPNHTGMRYLYSKADWSRFRAAAACTRTVAMFESIDDAVEYFNSTILTAADAAIPRTSGVQRTKQVPWWSPDLRRAHLDKMTKMRRYYRTRLLQDKVAFNHARARFQYLQKTAQRQSWQDYVSTLTTRTPINKVWAKIKKIQGRYGGMRRPVLRHDNTLYTDPRDVANLFARNMSVVSQGLQTPAFQNHKIRQESSLIAFPPDDGSDYNVPFTLAELREALRRCSNTAAGDDGIHYSMVKHLPDNSMTFLLDLYNRIWTEGAFPALWRVAIVLPFPKPGKDTLEWMNYRPIALTSCLCKLQEKMVNDRLTWQLEHDKVLHPNQYGFRRGRSCPDVLARIDHLINQAFAQKHHVVAIFFDIEKAYDTTWKHHILRTLSSAGLCGPLPTFLANFLSERTFRVKVGTSMSDLAVQHEGVPQGSVLSCTLFALAINGLASCMPPSIDTSLYVDDFAIFTSSAHLPSAERRIQLAVNLANAWCQDHGFKFSTAKTVSMHFTRLRGVFPAPCFHLGHSPIRHVTETKFLGMVLDSKLYWSGHIRDLRTRCLQSLQLLSCLSHTTWGADRTTLLRVYRSLIRSRLDYGCQIYGSATATCLKTLDSIHHRALRLATGAFRSSPVLSLYAETGEPSLAHRRDKLSLQMYARLLAMPDTPAHSTLTSTMSDHHFLNRTYHNPFGFRVRQLLQSLGEDPPSVMPAYGYIYLPYLMPSPTFCPGMFSMQKTRLPSSALRGEFLTHSASHDDSATPVYTDGSKRDDGVGFAAVLPHRTISGRLPAASSVFTAELRAILPAVTFLIRLPQQEFIVYSDSQSALQSICNSFCLHPVVREIHRWLRVLHNRGKSVTFCWVPGHVGVAGNEQADRAAAAAVDNEFVSPVSLPARDYYAHFSAALRRRWHLSWQATGPNKLRSVKNSISVWGTSCRANRYSEVVLARIRIGHTKLTHEYLMTQGPPPYCGNCLVPLTICHILTECPDHLELRRTCFGSDGLARPLHLRHILRDDELAVSALFTFLRGSGLLPLI